MQVPLIPREKPDRSDREPTYETPEHPNRHRSFVGKSRLQVYLDWLDELEELLDRHGQESVEVWKTIPSVKDLAIELRAVGEAIEEIGAELKEVGDSIQHAEYDAHSIAKTSGGRSE